MADQKNAETAQAEWESRNKTPQQLWEENNRITIDGVQYTPSELEKSRNKSVNYVDPYKQLGDNASSMTSSNAPKVDISGGKVRVYAPQSVLDSPYVEQLKKELQSLTGANLSDPGVIKAVNSLNEEIQTNWQNSLIQQTTGWTPEEYADYQYALQTVTTTNPLKSSNLLKGKDKDGNIIKKTPQEWVDYWRSIYNTDERVQALLSSMQSKDPYERTMALVLNQGGDKNVYGFDSFERLGQAFGQAKNQWDKLKEGLWRNLATDSNTKEVEERARKLKISSDTLAGLSKIDNEEKFNKMKDSIKGKSWSELSDEQKAFVLELGVSKQDSSALNNKFARQINLGPGKYYQEALNEMSSNSSRTSKDAIDSILAESSYDKFRKTSDGFAKAKEYDDKNNEDDLRLAQNAIMSGTEQTLGAFGGTAARFVTEALLLKAATGGAVNVGNISEALGGKMVQALSKIGIHPASTAGQTFIRFGADLLGTIPEDIIQDSIDNVLTYNEAENEHLLDPNNIASNLAFAALFNTLRATGRAVRNAVAINKAKKDVKLNSVINDDTIDEAQKIIDANKTGGRVVTEDGRVVVVHADGTTEELTHITTEQANLANDILTRDQDGKPSDFGTVDYMNRPKTVDDYKYEQNVLKVQLDDLETRRRSWVDNDYKDEFGNDVRIRETNEFGTEEIEGSSKLERIDAEIQRKKDLIAQYDEKINAAAAEAPKMDTSKIDEEGGEPVKKANYETESLNQYLNERIVPTENNIRTHHAGAVARLMNEFKTHLSDFHNKFGDVQASDFDYVNYLTRQGYSPEQIVGKTDPVTGRIMDQNKIDAMKWWSEQPFTRDLRKASLEAIGSTAEDFDKLGYLPHTDYDPTNMSYSEAVAQSGALWKKSTGASVLGENGEYKGFGGDFESRYKTFVSNMLWDAKNKDVRTARLVDEARMDGQEVTPELIAESRKAVDADQDLQAKIDSTPSTKDLNKILEPGSEGSADEWKALDEKIKKEGETSGISKAKHDNYRGVYSGWDAASVKQQRGGLKNGLTSFDEFLKHTILVDKRGNEMRAYDWGFADVIYAEQNALFMLDRVQKGEINLHDAVVEYLVDHSHRPEEYANEIADKWLAKIGEIKGDRTYAKIADSLRRSMYWEGMNRINKWLAMAKYDQFNESTRKTLDRFLFNHMQMNSVKGNNKIINGLSKALDVATELRYDALFYGNFKNALLQTTELNRLASCFKWGDVAKMLGRLTTDADFRAEVDDFARYVIPDETLKSEIKQAARNNPTADQYKAFSQIADSMEVGENGTTFNKLKNAKEVADTVALGPINLAENVKNRVLVAALVEEANNKQLTGDAKLNYIRQRFERVGLAVGEMGKIGLSSSRLAKPFLFLQTFQIREIGMHIYNISDLTSAVDSKPKKLIEAWKYLSKVFGSKLATTLMMARLGYSASQTMGLDPLGLANDYNQLDEEDRNWIDNLLTNGALTPLVSGGMTSLLADMYFMARSAYEDSVKETVSDEAAEKLEDTWGFGWDKAFNFDNLLGGAAKNFIPGSTFFNRVQQMNEMLDKGWATSSTGNKMYTAPNDALNIILGYLFGRSATSNAQQYNQTYGKDLFQTIGRTAGKTIQDLLKTIGIGGGYQDFDPIDTKNYSDWFNGDENDLQQFEKGRRYFQDERDKILDAYEDAISTSYASESQIAEAQNEMNARLQELYEQLARFVDAYENKNGSITPAMTKKIVSLLNTGRNITGTAEERADRRTEESNRALQRYTDLELPAVGTYSGAYESKDDESAADRETYYQGSPQYRANVKSYKNRGKELVAVLKQADKTLDPIRDEVSDRLSEAYDKNDWDEVERIQNEYLDQFDQVVAPIIAAYGNDVLTETDVANQLSDMLSTGTKKRSGNLIPSDHYRKDKNGKYRNMPYEKVDVGKWAQQRFRSNTFSNPTITGIGSAGDDIAEIERLYQNGQTDSARARALVLKTRVDNQTRSLSKEQYNWLNNFLEGGK